MNIAQIASTPPEFSHNALLWTVGLLLVLSTLGGFALQIANLARGSRRQIEPNPLIVALQKDFATKDEIRTYVPVDRCKILHGQLDQRLCAIEDSISSMREQLALNREQMTQLVRDEMGKVHHRIDALLEAVAEVRGRMNSQS